MNSSHLSAQIFSLSFSLITIWKCQIVQTSDIFIYFREREEGWGEREKHRFVVLLIYAFISWFLYVPWPANKPTTLAYWDLCSNQLNCLVGAQPSNIDDNIISNEENFALWIFGQVQIERNQRSILYTSDFTCYQIVGSILKMTEEQEFLCQKLLLCTFIALW